MAARIQRLVVRLDPEDIAAYQSDLRAIFMDYGDPDCVAPHNRQKLEAEMERAGDVFKQCILVIDA